MGLGKLYGKIKLKMIFSVDKLTVEPYMRETWILKDYEEYKYNENWKNQTKKFLGICVII